MRSTLHALLLLSFLGCPSVWAGEPVAALKFTQKHYYWGETEFISAARGVRIDNHGRMSFSLTARPPQWQVVIFRNDDKTCFSENLKDFVDNSLLANFVLGRAPEQYDGGGKMRPVRMGQFLLRKAIGPEQTFAYLPLNELTPAQASSVASGFFKSPTNGGIPIYYSKKLVGRDWLSGLDRTGSYRLFLETSKIEKVTVDSALFEAPRGFRQCKSAQEVLVSKENRDMAGDMDVMFQSGATSKSKKH